MDIDTEKIKSEIWVKNWAGNWSVLSCSYFGKQYSQRITDYLGVSLERSIIIIRKGFSICYFSKQEIDKLGKELSNRVIADRGLLDKWIKDIRIVTDDINEVIAKLKNKLLDKDEYSLFLNKFIGFGACNFAVKKIVDYLPKDILEESLKKLSDARLYSESVYADTEKFMEELAEKIGKKEGYKPELVLSLLDKEFEAYLENQQIDINKDILQNRFNLSAIFFRKGQDTLLVEKEAENLEQAMVEENLKELSGKSAFPGKVRGIARVVLDPSNVKEFNSGDILVTSMTRPEYLHLIQKSSAFITDAGGMLCHAAITAREIKKPCVVGLEMATRNIKDGNEIEVDAYSGIVKIIK